MKTARHTSRPPSPLKIVGLFAVLLALLILLVILFAPKKPVAPPVSTVSYESRPDRRDQRPSWSEYDRSLAADEASLTLAAETFGEEDTGPFVLSGTVTDEKTGEKIEGARVFARREWTAEEEEDWSLREQAAVDAGDTGTWDTLKDEQRLLVGGPSGRTDVEGHYELSLVLSGDYVLSFQHDNYVNETQETGGIGRERPDVQVDVALSRGASVSGRVTESGTSIGAAGVAVMARPYVADQRFRGLVFDHWNYVSGQDAYTDENGYYTLEGFSSGSHEIALNLAHSAYTSPGAIPYRRVDITGPKQAITGVDFTVDAAGIVWGYVTTPENEPAPKTNLLLVTSKSIISQAVTAAFNAAVQRRLPIQDTSESDGYYELAGVPLNTEWQIHALSPDHAPQLSDPFILTEGARSVRIDIFVFDGTTVYGRIVEPDGGGVDGAEVVCFPGYEKLVTPLYTAQAFRETKADEAGWFSITQLPGGSYQVFAMKEGYQYSLMGEPIYPDGYSDLENVLIVLRPVDAGDHSIYGTVSSRRGDAIAGANVSLGGFGTQNFGAVGRETQTNERGEFHIDGVEPGMYMLHVQSEAYAPATVSRVLLNSPTHVILDAAALIRGEVRVKSGGQLPRTYTVSAEPRIEGQGLSISLLQQMSEGASRSFSAPDGRFELRLAAGSYALHARSGNLRSARVDVDLEAGELREDIVLSLIEPRGRIAGRVVTPSGRMPQGVSVQLVEAGSPGEALALLATLTGRGQHQAVADADGAFEFIGLSAGSYTVVAQHPGFAQGRSGLIALEEDGTVSGVVVRLGRGGALEGYAYSNGTVVAGATVVVSAGDIPAVTTTDEEGYYYIDALPAGSLQVTLMPGSVERFTETQGAVVEIEDGMTTRHDFGTGSGVRIEGICDPPPQFAGVAFLRPPGSRVPEPGEPMDLTLMTGSPAIIGPGGVFQFQDVHPGEWQLDVFYTQLPLARYVHTEFVTVTGEDDILSLTLAIRFF